MRAFPWMLLLLLTGCRACYRDVHDVALARSGRLVDPEFMHEATPQPQVVPPEKSSPDKVTPGAALSMPWRPQAVSPATVAHAIPTLTDDGTRAQLDFKPEGDFSEEQGDPPITLLDRLQVPRQVPGGTAADIRLPSDKASPEEKEAALKKYFPALPPLPVRPPAQPGPFGHPLTLAELQKLALTNSPLIRQAAADVEQTRGAALQAGLYPNPTIGFEGDNYNQGHTAGTTGGFVGQTIKTPGKLGLARAAALQDLRMAELKLRQAESDLQTQVRAGYFAVLAAQKNLEVNQALAQLTDEVYKVLVEQLKVGEVAAYEPIQLRVLALQARGQSIQAYNRYVSAWKQLASSLGLPTMPLTEVAGRIDMPIPRFQFDNLLARVLSRHTDVLATGFGVDKAQYLLKLARLQPVPDMDVRVVIQKDYTSLPHAVMAGVQVGVPVPLWDRNQGNIQAADALLQRAWQENQRVRSALTSRVAEAFERYDNNRQLLELYQTQILPNQVQAFRAAVARHAKEGGKGVSYNDLVTAEQALVTLLTSYLGALSDQWIAVVDLGNLLQTDDIFQVTEEGTIQVCPIPDLHVLANVHQPDSTPRGALVMPPLRR